jgi:cystine transport system permease protein
MSDSVTRILQILADSFLPLLKAGLQWTCTLTLISFFFGMILAFILAICRLSKYRVLRIISGFVIWFVRGVPLIVLLFIIFYGLPNMGLVLPALLSAAVGFSVNEGAYNAEVIRSAILSIPKGQWEATKALGMKNWQTLRYVVIPQATRVAIPPISNNFISLVKDTSLAAIITVPEMFQRAQQIVAVTYEPMWLYLEVGGIYLIFSSILTYGQSKMEKKFGKHVQNMHI